TRGDVVWPDGFDTVHSARAEQASETGDLGLDLLLARLVLPDPGEDLLGPLLIHLTQLLGFEQAHLHEFRGASPVPRTNCLLRLSESTLRELFPAPSSNVPL